MREVEKIAPHLEHGEDDVGPHVGIPLVHLLSNGLQGLEALLLTQKKHTCIILIV